MQMTKEYILDFLRTHKDEFSAKYQVSDMALFGSYARGENQEESDIDIAIKTDLSDYFKLYNLKEELEKAFQSKVDIVRLRDRMNQSLKQRILNEGIYVR